MLSLLKIYKNSKHMHIWMWNGSRNAYKKLLIEVASEDNWVAGGSGHVTTVSF